jgi:hypothetical protein
MFQQRYEKPNRKLRGQVMEHYLHKSKVTDLVH